MESKDSKVQFLIHFLLPQSSFYRYSQSQKQTHEFSNLGLYQEHLIAKVPDIQTLLTYQVLQSLLHIEKISTFYIRSSVLFLLPSLQAQQCELVLQISLNYLIRSTVTGPLSFPFNQNYTPYKRNNNNQMEPGDELPCGGYYDQDQKIKAEIKSIVEQKQEQRKESSCGDCSCQPEVKKQSCGKICKKCNKEQAVLFHKGEPICQACLFRNMDYKARLLLENTFKVEKTSNLLLCLSGGLSSICMLNIVISIVKKYQKNKLFNRLGCIHIQQQAALPPNYKEDFLKQTGIELIVLKIEDIMLEGGRNLSSVQNLLSQFSKGSNTIDLITIFRDRLINKYASENGYDYILKGLNGDTLASQLFSYFTKGLGGNLPGLCADHSNKGPFYYPLRSHSRKELQYYYHMNRLSKFAIKNEEDNLQNFTTSELDGQIREFIDTLQQMYSHTAPAIVRTAEKIETNVENKTPCNWCFLSGAAEHKLCRRCLRIWEGKKKNAKLQFFPLIVQ